MPRPGIPSLDSQMSSSSIGSLAISSPKSPTKSNPRTPKAGPRYLARPDVGSLVQSKYANSFPKDLDEPQTLKQLPLTKKEESAIVKKEDALEAIMSMESQQGFVQMGYYQLNKARVTRVAVNPAGLENLDKLDYLITEDDLISDDPNCQDAQPTSEFFESNDLLRWSASSQEYHEGSVLPDWLLDIESLGIGFGFPDSPLQTQTQGGEEGGVGDPNSSSHNPRSSSSSSTAAPCQDRIFAARCGEFTMVGIANGHGKPRTSEALCAKIAEALPLLFLQSVPFMRNDIAGGLVNAFHLVHREASMELNLALAGAAVTVALVDDEHVWIAHVGDCRAVLGVPDVKENAEQFHFDINCLTSDHTLAVKKEFDRIADHAGECRKLVGDNVYRLYIGDCEVPGLTLTRAIGDRLAHAVGLTHLPSVSMFKRQDAFNGKSFLVIGTGAFWSVMPERTVSNWVGRHFADPADAAASLAREAAVRWEDPNCISKRALRATLPEFFSTIVLFFNPQQASAEGSARVFGLGPASPRERREWNEVRVMNRVDKLRPTQLPL
mmetsp:Transcript_65299/g.141747  ORF Transcript_65299/g.141747 Transcript_65299/m.141747 type:complete len:551 (+) Transcript_65299:74-1726(+)